ncbi:hypothetical protein [Quadrisphaera setariae]|uniref:Uncharacterized protein n=1 Tax=Quadrisphaera setariae TaxID=2593304 RepID=A0A5C8ZAG0_9ACTN|nr:hypothetical protein [Quadrisphaera setariae]TXR55085.1 hypothetical protein FMM08_16490 [Quadrisphaera setariae]
MRAEHGSGVRIIKAERVRVGGFVGFFAREQFEVTVEVDTPAVTSAPQPAFAAPAALVAGGGGAALRPATTALPAVPNTAEGIEQLLAAAEAADGVPASLSGFDSIFNSVVSGGTPTSPLAAAPAAAPARQPAAPPPALTPVAEVIKSVVSGAAAPPTAGRLVAPRAAPPTIPPAAQPAAQRQVTVLPDTPVVAVPPPSAHALRPAVLAQPPVDLPVAPAPAPAPHHVAAAPVHAPAPVAATPAPVPPVTPAHRAAVPTAHPLAERLADLGVPQEWLHHLPSDRTEVLRRIAAHIAEQQASRPRPVTGPAPVIGVLGEPAAALELARRLGAGMGLHAADVAVVQRRAAAGAVVLTDALAVNAEALRAREDGRPLVVALPAPIGASAAHRAAMGEVLAALGADEVWAVVDATRRLPDTAAWLEQLGAVTPVDALALVNVDATSAPAAALGLPQPVVVLGDRPASPRAWARVLAKRLRAQDAR